MINFRKLSTCFCENLLWHACVDCSADLTSRNLNLFLQCGLQGFVYHPILEKGTSRFNLDHSGQKGAQTIGLQDFPGQCGLEDFPHPLLVEGPAYLEPSNTTIGLPITWYQGSFQVGLNFHVFENFVFAS